MSVTVITIPPVIGRLMSDIPSIELLPTRPGFAFSNDTEYECWQSNWCFRCTRDQAFMRGELDDGCPLLTLAMMSGVTPEAWVPDKLGSLGSQYRCEYFEAVE